MFVRRSFQVHAVKGFWGIKIDNKLTFEERVEGLCKKASQKKSVLWQKFCFKRNLNKEIVSLIDS